MEMCSAGSWERRKIGWGNLYSFETDGVVAKVNSCAQHVTNLYGN